LTAALNARENYAVEKIFGVTQNQINVRGIKSTVILAIRFKALYLTRCNKI